MKEFDLIVQNGLIVTEANIFKGDIGIKDGKIAEISNSLTSTSKAKDIIDANGLHVLPGLIDVHVHLNEPGRVEWEGITTGTQSLAAGGVTAFFDMPLNSDPPTINSKLFNDKKKLMDEKSVIDYGILGGMIPENLDILNELKKSGVIGLKAFMSNSGIKEFSYLNDNSLYKGMKKAAELNLIMMLHAESEVITSNLTREAIEEGNITPEGYEKSRPIVSEIEAVTRALCFAKVTKCKIHIVHASDREVVKLAYRAKLEGIDVSVETCPHYLSLTVNDIKKYGAIAKCSPPIHYEKNVNELWKAIFNDEVDFVSSDHSPSSPNLKLITEDRDIFTVWGGISSAQTTLNVMLEEGYFKRGLSLEKIVKLTSANPARRFGIYPTKGKIAVGSDGDLAIVDLNERFILRKEALFYKHKNSPYIEKEFRGKIVYTIVRGNKIFEKNKIIKNNFKPQIIK